MAAGTQRLRRLALAPIVCVSIALLQSACGGCGSAIKSIRPNIVVAPEAITFETTAIGSGAEQPVNVTNTGRGLLKIESITVADQTDIAVPSAKLLTTNCDDSPRTVDDPLTVAPGECARFAVRFAPKTEQDYSTKIVIVSDDDLHNPLEIPVTAKGVAAPIGTIKVCVLSPEGEEGEAQCSKLGETPPFIPMLDFGPVLYQEPILRKVRIHNEGTGSLSLSDVHIESDVPDFQLRELPGLPIVVQPGESTDLQVAVVAEGNTTVGGNLSITSNDGSHSPILIPLSAEEEGPCLKVDPTGNLIDFGVVAVGSTRTLSLRLENCGHVPYELSTFDFVRDNPSSTVFTLPGGNPQAPISFPPGQTLTVDINYKPITNHAAADAGDTATFSIRTSYGARNAIRVVGHGSLSCGGMLPNAVIRVLNSSGTPVNVATTPFAPLANVTIDGSTSTAATSWSIYKYDWQLVSAPTNSTSKIGTTKSFPFFLDLAGNYVISLVVGAKDTGGNTCQSQPAQVTIQVVPPPGIHVELTWPESFGDIDAHYVGPGGDLYQTSSNTPKGDIYWIYSKQTLSGTKVVNTSSGTAPDWGKNNQVYPDGNKANDARIDVDQIWGKGPENIDHPKPFDGTYKVIAHTYCNRSCTQDIWTGAVSCTSSLGAVTAHVRIYIDGVLQFDASQSMRQRDVWEAATVTVSGPSVTVTQGTTPLYKLASRGSSNQGQACSTAGD